MKRAAAIDIGTNSVLLTVAELSESGGTRALVPVVERARITRLGEGVDRNRLLAPAAVERTLACLRDYAAELRALRVSELYVVGTSALRDAGGGPDFVDRALALLGTRPRVIDGREEAELTFDGALSGIALSGEVTVFDVGGGSTEVIHGLLEPSSRRIDSAVSLDIGSVRLFERHSSSDPPSTRELADAEHDIDQALATVPPPRAGSTLVGVAGTVTTLAALAQKLATYEPARVHGARLELASVETLYEKLRSLPVESRRSLPGLEPMRADVIVFGALIVRSVLKWSMAPALIASDRGVRWGLLERQLGS